jgi:hypothetical protein
MMLTSQAINLEIYESSVRDIRAPIVREYGDLQPNNYQITNDKLTDIG